MNVVATDKPSVSNKKKGRAVASNAKARSVSSPYPCPSGRAKGTPGAGVHLKRPPTNGDATPSKNKAGA